MRARSDMHQTKYLAGQAASHANAIPSGAYISPSAAAAKPSVKASDTAQSVSRLASGDSSET